MTVERVDNVRPGRRAQECIGLRGASVQKSPGRLGGTLAGETWAVAGVFPTDDVHRGSRGATALRQLSGEAKRRPHRVVATCDKQKIGSNLLHSDLCGGKQAREGQLALFVPSADGNLAVARFGGCPGIVHRNERQGLALPSPRCAVWAVSSVAPRTDVAPNPRRGRQRDDHVHARLVHRGEQSGFSSLRDAEDTDASGPVRLEKTDGLGERLQRDLTDTRGLSWTAEPADRQGRHTLPGEDPCPLVLDWSATGPRGLGYLVARPPCAEEAFLWRC